MGQSPGEVSIPIGVTIGGNTVDAVVAATSAAHTAGMQSVWLSQIFSVDALTALAVAGREVPDIALGTGVVPTYPRHPMMLAAQARTTQQASNGRLHLGIGLSHKVVIESMLGMSFDKPLRHMREYLSILMPLANGEPSGYAGETLTGHVTLDVPCDPVPVLVAALGEKMLELAGAVSAGTMTWMTGGRTIAEHIVPTINAAAQQAGRPTPRVVVSLPVAVTDDPASARATANDLFAIYGTLPSYRAMLDREGADGPGDVAVVGTEDEVAEQISQLATGGATEFVAAPFANLERTTELLASLAAR
jgi:F420-dependent oxidoreductase-like protein